MNFIKRIKKFFELFHEFRHAHDATLIQAFVWAFDAAKNWHFYTLGNGQVKIGSNTELTPEQLAEMENASLALIQARRQPPKDKPDGDRVGSNSGLRTRN